MKRAANQEIISYHFNRSLLEEGDPGSVAWARRVQFRVVSFQHALVGPEWGSEGRFEGDYLHHINMVVRGGARLWRDGRAFELQPGFAYLLPGNVRAQRACPELYETYYLKFRCEWFSGVDFLLDWPERDFKLLGPWDSREWAADWGAPLDMNASLRLQSQLVRWVADAVPDLGGIIQRHVDAHAHFENALALMDSQLGATLRMSEVASAQGMTLHGFSMAFRRVFGLSPKAYFNRRLNEEILRCVTDTDALMTQIAEQFGFSDEYYFNRFFTKMNGIAPLRYRKRKLSGV